MSAQVQVVAIHSPEQVRAIIAEAWAIAGDLDLPQNERRATFEKAADLLATRVTLQPMPAQMMGSLDLSQLRTQG